MGRDKALLEIDGQPLWKRQLSILEELQPREIFIAAPAREEWRDHLIIPDAQSEVGPLAGLISALRRSSTSHLLALAVDLPQMTSGYLRELLDFCSEIGGAIPRSDRFEPLAALYPTSSLPIAEDCLRSGEYSLQNFAAECVARGLVRAVKIEAGNERLFANVNTPDDLLALTRHE